MKFTSTPCHRTPSVRKGFTLVELSIVLVIIGLLIGGILGGQELIRSSELNSVSADVTKFTTAANAFKLKYNAIPGDMPNATAYWGTASGGCPGGTGSGTQTCNGNGNGTILIAGGESWRAWQQLANAGIVPGNYTGLTGPAGAYDPVLGTNTPASKINGTGYLLINPIEGGWTAGSFITAPIHLLMFGAPVSNGGLTNPAVSNQDARSLDAKSDDGAPGSGSVVSFTSAFQAGCATTSVSTTATYTLSSTTSQACTLFFKTF